MENKYEDIETTQAYLLRQLDDLSDVVARQDQEIRQLQTQVKLLLTREAEREREGAGGVILGDERPPHY